MNEKYWKKFYSNQHISRTHSSFAEFCLPYMNKNYPLIDFGCGNGRDSYYFARNGLNVFGVDKATKPKNRGKAKFYQVDFSKIELFETNQVYARFFLHAIEHLDIIRLIDSAEDLVMFEFRNVGDDPQLFKNHKRTSIDGRDIFDALVVHGFNIMYYTVSRGLAKYKTEDPLICRIIATKKSL